MISEQIVSGFRANSTGPESGPINYSHITLTVSALFCAVVDRLYHNIKKSPVFDQNFGEKSLFNSSHPLAFTSIKVIFAMFCFIAFNVSTVKLNSYLLFNDINEHKCSAHPYNH